MTRKPVDVRALVTAPDEIEVPLVRGDFFGISTAFRCFFELFLAITATLFGVILTLPKITIVLWIFFLFVFCMMLVFLLLSLVYYSKAKSRKK